MKCWGKDYECTGCAYSDKTNTVYYCTKYTDGESNRFFVEEGVVAPEYQSEGLGDW